MQDRSLHVPPKQPDTKITNETLQEKNKQNGTKTGQSLHLHYQLWNVLLFQLLYEFIFWCRVITCDKEQRVRMQSPLSRV